jgi:hypothetical protein
MSQNILVVSYVDKKSGNLMISTAAIVGNPPVLGTFITSVPIPVKPTSPKGPYQSSSTGGAFWAVLEAPNFNTFGPLSFVYVSNDGLNKLLVTTSGDGKTWTPSTEISSKESKAAPTVAVWGGGLITLACLANSSDRLLVTTSSDGSTWSANQEVGQSSLKAPALALLPGEVGNGPMVLVYRATDSNDLLLTWETDTINPWVVPQTIPGARSNFAPALCAYNDLLVLAYVSDHGGTLVVKTSANVVELGNNWSAAHDTGLSALTTPAIAAFGDGLVMVYVGWDELSQVNTLFFITCPDPYGQKWTTPVPIFVGNDLPAPLAPALFIY